MIAKTDSSLLLALSYVSHFEPKNGVFVVYLLRLMFRDYRSFKFAKLLNQHSVHPCSDVYPRGLKSHTWSSGLVGGDITQLWIMSSKLSTGGSWLLHVTLWEWRHVYPALLPDWQLANRWERTRVTVWGVKREEYGVRINDKGFQLRSKFVIP